MVGVDVVEIQRVVNSNKKDAFINKVLTDNERQYLSLKSQIRNNKYSEYDCTLAGFWAAKEAVLKALQIGIVTDLKNIEILHKQNGVPYVNLNAEFCKNYNIASSSNIDISISHDAGIAICVCFIV